MLDEVLFERHEVFHIVEANLRLNHPELCKVAWGIAVLGTEGRAERIDLTESCSTELTFELTRHCERSHLAEEIVVIDDAAVLVLLEVVEVLGSDLEHLTSALAVACCDERSMEIVESVLMEILVDGDCHIVTDAEDAAEEVGTRTEVSLLAKELHRVTFLLERILVRIAVTEHLDGRSLDLARLVTTLACNELTRHLEAGTSLDALERSLVELFSICNNLNTAHA